MSNIKVNHTSHKNSKSSIIKRWIENAPFQMVVLRDGTVLSKDCLLNSLFYRNMFIEYAVDILTPSFVRITRCKFTCSQHDFLILASMIDLTDNEITII